MVELGIVLQGILVLVGIGVARAAINTARTPQGATAWVVFLVSFPLLAIPAYAAFGGIVRANRRDAPPPVRETGRDGTPAEGRLAPIRHIAEAPLVPGNDARLLIDGTATFEAIFAAIDAAQTEVLVQFYTIRNDALGQALSERLIAAARRGVRVRVLCDVVGSLWLGFAYVRRLREAGVAFQGNVGPHRSLLRVGVNFRNHRKAVIVDNRIGLTGGINAGQEYIDGGAAFDSWRDTFVRLEGPVVTGMRTRFTEDWQAVSQDATPFPALPEAARHGEVSAMAVSFGPTDPAEKGSLLMCGLVGLARRRLWLTTPYLVPHTDLLTALQLAALRGVEVKILVPLGRDHFLPWHASRAYFGELESAGAEIREYQPGFMHQKIMLIDDDIAAVGTVNLDIRSILLNFEQMALIEDRAFAAEVEAMLTADFARTRPAVGMADRPGLRLLAPVARLFGPLL